MKLELRHLQIVVAVADHGSVSRAASALGMAQPALTAQLQRIERTLGGPLFARDWRGARPTDLGELVLARARTVLPAMADLLDEAARVAHGQPARRYRIGATNGPILGGLVHRLTTEDPDADLSTHTAWSSAELAEQLLSYRLDFAVVGVCGAAAPPAEHELRWRPIATDAVFVLLPEQHPLAAGASVRLSELAGMQWVAAPGRSCLYDCLVDACARAGFSPRTVFEGDVRTCIGLVESGDAVGLCQSSFRPPAGLSAVPIEGTPLWWRHMLGWHPESPGAPEADRLVRLARESYRDAVTRSPELRDWLARHPEYGVASDA